MANETDNEKRARHLRITDPSPWVTRFAPLIKEGGTALDLACGGGRHSRHFLKQGIQVVSLDRVTEAVEDLSSDPNCEIITADLEGVDPVFLEGGVLAGRTFDAVVVVNYLHRELFGDLIEAINPGGVFIYETFARGNEVFTRPRNPDHLLKSGELLGLLEGRLQVVAYEHGIVEKGPLPGVIQRICGVKPAGPSQREDGEPGPQRVHP
jgi:SAM-dependent methyltransferase